MAFNKIILMFAIIAASGIFQATCFSEKDMNKFVGSLVMDECKTNETDEIFDELMNNSTEKLDKCRKENVMDVIYYHQMTTNSKMFNYEADNELFCNLTSASLKCNEKFFDDMLFCKSEIENKIRKDIDASVQSYLNYICSDYGRRISAIVETKDCIRKNLLMSPCLIEMIFGFSNNINKLIENFSPKVGKCVLDALDQCPSSDPQFSPSVSAKQLLTHFGKLLESVSKAQMMNVSNKSSSSVDPKKWIERKTPYIKYLLASIML